MGCGGNGACTVSSTFIAGGNAPSGCLSCGGAGTSGALAGCACKHKHPSKPAEIQFSGGEGATPPGNRVPANFVTVPPPKKDAKRPGVPFVPGANKADVPSSQNNGGIGRFAPPIAPPAKQSNGKAPIPSRIFDAPADLPVSMPPPKESAAPVPFLPTTPMIGLAADPSPFAPYCGNGIDAASELCRAASDAGLSDYCRQQLLAFLGSKSSQTLGSWIASQELCDQAALRRAVGIAEASIAAKASSGLYRASGGTGNNFVIYGMPHGGTVNIDDRPVMGRWLDAGLTRWEVPLPDANPHRVVVLDAGGRDIRGQDVLAGSTLVWSQMPVLGGPLVIDGFATSPLRRPFVIPPGKGNPFAPQNNGSTMDWRNPSGGMPNYHRPSGGTPTLAEWTAQGNDPEQWQAAFGGEHTGSNAFTASNIQAFNQSQAGADLYRRELAQAAAASPPATPPPDYAAIIGSIGQAVGGVFSGINTAVQNTEANRLRELEINYANNARGAQLALAQRQQEINQAIAQLSANASPAANALADTLRQQNAEYQTRIQRLEQESSQGMSPVTVGAIVVGGVAVLGLGAYALMGKRRR